MLAAAPALPLDDAGPYVAAAFLVFFGVVLLYVAIMAMRLSTLERELAEVSDAAGRITAGGSTPTRPLDAQETTSAADAVAAVAAATKQDAG